MSWLIPPTDLTPDQQRAVQLGINEHRAIIGGPGSGKTQILLHRARYLCDHFKIPNNRFRIFVYTNVLKGYIKSALQDLRLPEENVLTFDHWCRLFYQQHISDQLPWNGNQPDFTAIRYAVMQHWDSRPACSPIFDFVLVDEGQDLEENVFRFLTQISRHVTVCVDNKQQIYDQGTTESGILSQLGIRRNNVNLVEAFRVCPYIVEVAAQLIPDREERAAFLNVNRLPQIERQTPCIYFATAFDDEKQMLYQMVKDRLLQNDRVGIFFPTNRQVFGFAQGLKEIGIEVEVPAQQGHTNPLPTHDFTTSRPKLMSYHSAKGLTFDSVFLPRLVPNSFPHMRLERIERLLFVGITRATKWCYLSTVQGNSLPVLLNKIKPLAEQRKVTLLEGIPHHRNQSDTDGAMGDQHDLLDFL